MKLFFVVTFGLILLGSCAVHQGTFSSTSFNEPVVYKDVAFGVAESKKLFGIGGLKQDALILEAKRALMSNNPIQLNEQYANFTIDFKRSYYLIYWNTKVTLCADIISTDTRYEESAFTENYKRKLFTAINTNELFAVGDSIIFNTDKTGVISSFTQNGKARFIFKNEANQFYSKTMDLTSIHTSKKPFKNYNVHDTVVYLVNNVPQTGRIVALGLKSALVKNGTRIEEIPYLNVKSHHH